jgi:hypothetical protein
MRENQNPLDRTPVSRRTGLRLGVTGALGAAALAVPGTADAAPTDAGSDRGGTPRPGDTAHVRVTATTLWSEPETQRDGIDDPAVSTPVDLARWNENMPDTETRKWLTGKIESQAVLGSEVVVDEVEDEWAHIVVTAQGTPKDDRGYPGWVPLDHLVVDEDFAERARTRPTATVTARRTVAWSGRHGHRTRIPLSFDTVLPVGRTTHGLVEVAVPGAHPYTVPVHDVVVREPGELPPRPTADDVIATGRRFLGLRYLWAGVSAYGFDCSGFTYTLFHHHGITLQRDAGDQMHHSDLTPVDREDLQRGDLVFFSTEPGADSIRHVALYVGGGKIMQAPNAARSVEVMSLEEYDTDDEYAGARRVALAD